MLTCVGCLWVELCRKLKSCRSGPTDTGKPHELPVDVRASPLWEVRRWLSCLCGCAQVMIYNSAPVVDVSHQKNEAPPVFIYLERGSFHRLFSCVVHDFRIQ